MNFDITMAFQPIVDVSSETIFAYEALVRGTEGQGAGHILSQVDEDTRYTFDQLCRTTAIQLASDLNLQGHANRPYVSINFMPNAVYEPRACIRQTLAAAMQTGFPLDRILFEFTEQERLDTAHIINILRAYRSMGFATAINDFGAGHAGLNLLAAFQPDFIKLDMDLIRGIDTNTAKQTIVRSVLGMASDLGVRPICEGIETQAEYDTLADLGVTLMQGYLFAKPELAALPDTNWPGRARLQKAAG